MLLRFAHAGDFHLDEDQYFADTAQCLEWFVADAIGASVDLFVIDHCQISDLRPIAPEPHNLCFSPSPW